MNFKKIVVILLVCSMFIASASSAIASNFNPNNYDEAFMEAQQKCVEMYHRLTSGMDKEIQNSYGGAYIDENQNLVVLLNNMKITNIIKVEQLTGIKNLIIKSCEYTYDELVSTINIISVNMSILPKKGVVIDEVYDNLYSNQVEIYIRDINDKKINEVKSIVDEQYMVFFNSEKGPEACMVDIKGGYEITPYSGSPSSTLGFCAYRNGVSGYVISGHAGDYVGKEFRYLGTMIGYVDVVGLSTTTTADASFVEASGYWGTLTDNIVPGDIVGASTSDYPVGTTVGFYGEASGAESGTIQSNNYTSYYLGCTISDCMRASFSVQAGDSGAPVYYTYNGGYIILGIVNSSFGSCTKYSNIVSVLGATCKTN